MLLSDSDETFSLMEIIKSNVSQKNFSLSNFCLNITGTARVIQLVYHVRTCSSYC